VGKEQAFLIGVRVLSGTLDAGKAGCAYSAVADHLIAGLHEQVEAQMQEQHGRLPGGQMVVIGMGKLGSEEMTASSDLDLLTVYDFDDGALQSDGTRPLSPTQYYARQTQRLIAALSAPTAEGQLYEVDMRLRPSGKAGPVATRFASFASYQASEAWTWEHMALTRARIVAGPPALKDAVTAAIAEVLRQPRDRARTVAHVHDMRRRIAEEKGSKHIWDIKVVRGGLVDVEFIAQFLQLVHAHEHPDVLDRSTIGALTRLGEHGLLAADDAATLLKAAKLYHGLTQVLRLCFDGRFDPASAPEGLKTMLCRAADAPDFSAVEATLAESLETVAASFERLVV
jgi:glutamate-ammonia-ligase adenylyltransferase